MTEHAKLKSHKSHFIRLAAIVFIVLGFIFVAFIGLAVTVMTFPLSISILIFFIPCLFFAFRQTIKNNDCKPLTACIAFAGSALFFFAWYVCCGAFHGSFQKNLQDNYFNGDWQKAAAYMQWFGLIFLPYIFISGHEFFKQLSNKENKRFGFPFIIASLLLFSAFFYNYFARYINQMADPL